MSIIKFETIESKLIKYHDVLYKIANNQKQNLSPQALHQVKV
ncbi:MAG: hypothetical protein ACQERD_04615 [Campylobacterota bacterium]